MRTVYGIDYSPWTQRACWALHVRNVPFRFWHYKPTLDEPRMRFRLGRWTGTVSVPILVDDERAIEGSEAIARFANEAGEGPDLFADEAEVARWCALAEPGLEYGRTRTIDALIEDPAAQAEALEAVLPASVAPAFSWVARSIARRTRAKYPAPPRSVLVDFLGELEGAVGDGGSYLVGDAITYADLVAATTLEVVEPGGHCRRGPHQRRYWTDDELASAHRGLFSWRDRLVEETGFSI